MSKKKIQKKTLRFFLHYIWWQWYINFFSHELSYLLLNFIRVISVQAIILFVAEKLINNRYTKINTGSYFKRPHIKQKKKIGI